MQLKWKVEFIYLSFSSNMKQNFEMMVNVAIQAHLYLVLELEIFGLLLND